jgi:hypothetical protein
MIDDLRTGNVAVLTPEAKTRALQMKCLRRIYRALVKAC